jgi:cytochrome oxidase Cu insertion factor (SCO1/SenC/PrrC family)
MKLQPARIMLLTIMAIFLLPLVIAWLMYAGPIDYRPDKTRNLGRLVVPVVPIDWTGVSALDGSFTARGVEGSWVILYPVPRHCENLCLEQITRLRQVHRAAGREQDRIRIVLLFDSTSSLPRKDEILNIYPNFNLATNPTHAFADALRNAGDNSALNDEIPGLYLVDPLGNIMMTYSGKDDADKLSKDLHRLLNLSKLDKRT